MYNIFQKQIYIKHYNITRASHGKLTSLIKKRTFSVSQHQRPNHTLQQHRQYQDSIIYLSSSIHIEGDNLFLSLILSIHPFRTKPTQKNHINTLYFNQITKHLIVISTVPRKCKSFTNLNFIPIAEPFAIKFEHQSSNGVKKNAIIREN